MAKQPKVKAKEEEASEAAEPAPAKKAAAKKDAPELYKVKPKVALSVRVKGRTFLRGKPQLLNAEERQRYASGDLTFSRLPDAQAAAHAKKAGK